MLVHLVRLALLVLLLFLLHGASDFALEVPSMALWLSLTLGLGCGLIAVTAVKVAAPPIRAVGC